MIGTLLIGVSMSQEYAFVVEYITALVDGAITSSVVQKKSDDVTNQLRSQTQIREFIDTANLFFFGVDVDGCVNEWNTQIQSVTGFTKRDVMGRPLVTTFIELPFRSTFKRVLDKALVDKILPDCSIALRTKTGKIITLLVSASARRNVGGSVAGVCVGGGGVCAGARMRAASCLRTSACWSRTKCGADVGASMFVWLDGCLGGSVGCE